MATRRARAAERKTSPDELVRRFPHARGGSAAFRRLPAAKKLAFLRGTGGDPSSAKRFLAVNPPIPTRGQAFELAIRAIAVRGERKIALIRFTIQFPSGQVRSLEYRPASTNRSDGKLIIPGLQSGAAGDLYVSARIYYRDGGTASDALVTTVLSSNPHQLIISPRAWLISGRAGRVEYDWDTKEFHCRAYGTITNGEAAPVTYNRCFVRVTDGGVNGTLISSFSFASGPFTVSPGGTAYRNIDTWYPKGSSVWDKFNKRWDLTITFTYASTGPTTVADSAVYRPMSTVPINAIKCDVFTASQTQAERDAVGIAAEILEDRDVTLYGPNWRIISSAAHRSKYGIIDVGWDNNTWDWGEVHEMFDDISGPESDRLDVFVPLGFAYADDVPADKRNVGGVSTVAGPFPKDDDPDRSGCMVLVDENDVDFFGVAVAHEICHYLGLGHVADDIDNNLMHKNGGLTGHVLTWQQWDKIRQHGMMKWLAPDI